MKTYIMTLDEQEALTPSGFIAALKEAGFKFDREQCPVKLTQPWGKVEMADGSIMWRQWEVEGEQRP
jgi:hypothetical protein